ncbi:MAG: cupin domain-containing protein [Bacteroidetes bacterium]|nr:cupin domain-containing protein [Bacteroidota bacterium]
MLRVAHILCLLFFLSELNAQTLPVRSFEGINTDTIGAASKTENLYNVPLYSDSLASSFCIVIKKEVKAHKHVYHSEHIIVQQGEGIMKLGERTFPIKKGDVIFIPKNQIHSVKTTGKTPLKVISIQAPLFDGKDRVMTEEK